MQIEMMPLERLVPYVRNARTHSEAQVAQIAASIVEFGFGRHAAEWIALVGAIFTGTLLVLVVGIPLGDMASDWLLYAGWWPVAEAWP